MSFRLLAFGWAMLFAWVHVYWLAGGSLGLPRAIVEARPPAIMLAAALAVPLLTIAALGALIGPNVPHRFARSGARVGVAVVALFCLAHSLSALLIAGGEALLGRLTLDEHRFYELVIYEPNWLLGGLFLAKVWRDWPARKPTPSAEEAE